MKQLKTISYVMSVITLAYFEYLWSAVFRSITTPQYRIDECQVHIHTFFMHKTIFLICLFSSSELRMPKTKKNETVSLFLLYMVIKSNKQFLKTLTKWLFNYCFKMMFITLKYLKQFENLSIIVHLSRNLGLTQINSTFVHKESIYQLQTEEIIENTIRY